MSEPNFDKGFSCYTFFLQNDAKAWDFFNFLAEALIVLNETGEIPKSAQKTTKCKASVYRVRSTRDVKSEDNILGMLSKGDEVVIYEERDGWILHNGGKTQTPGWSHKDGFEL